MKKKEEPKKCKCGWRIFITVIIMLIIMGIINSSNKDDCEDKLEDYQWCVEDCSWDERNCMLDVGIWGNVITWDEVMSCSHRLEFCMDDCEYLNS